MTFRQRVILATIGAAGVVGAALVSLLPDLTSGSAGEEEGAAVPPPAQSIVGDGNAQVDGDGNRVTVGREP